MGTEMGRLVCVLTVCRLAILIPQTAKDKCNSCYLNYLKCICSTNGTVSQARYRVIIPHVNTNATNIGKILGKGSWMIIPCVAFWSLASVKLS